MLKRATQQQVAFAFGLVFVIVLLAIALALPSPTDFQYIVFRIVLALAAAGIAAMLPGFLDVNIPAGIRASGALAVFVVVFFFSPAQLVLKPKPSLPDIPGNTGWVLLGYINAGDSTFDATGPLFTFVSRERHTGPYIPSVGDLIKLTKVRRVMIHGFMPNRSTDEKFALICAGYDEDADDTGIKLPGGTEVAVRDVGRGCQDYSQPGNKAAVWIRIAYPPAE